MVFRRDGQRRARRYVRREMLRHQRDDRVRILVGHEATGDLGVGLAGDHGLLAGAFISAPHAVDLDGRASPLALERRVARLAECGRGADLFQPGLLMERKGGNRGALRRREVTHAVVEPCNSDAAVRVVQRRDQARHGVQRVGDAPAVAARVQILGRGGERQLEPGKPTARYRERRFVDAPHRAVRRQHYVGGEQFLVVDNEVFEVATADLLLALEHELHVHRQHARRRKERLGDLDRDQHRSLVVGDASGVQTTVAHRRCEGGTVPLLQWVRRLHVVVTVDEHRQLARRTKPLAVNDRIARRGDRAYGDRSGGFQFRGDPLRGRLHVGGVRGIGAHARDCGELDEFAEYAVVIRPEMREDALG